MLNRVSVLILIGILCFSMLPFLHLAFCQGEARYWSIAQGESTIVGGYISENTTWTLSGSPYIVEGDVVVESGFYLTIEPGVLVEFNAGTNLVVDGGLIAQGDSINWIVFTSNASVPQPGDWGSIQLRGSSDTSVIEYGVIRFGTTGISTASSPRIGYCNISDSLYYGIDSTAESPSIYGCFITNNYIGIQIGGEGDAAPRITDNEITNNYNSGIYCNFAWSNSEPIVIERNRISSNGDGILSHISYDVQIFNNTISNSYYGIWSPPVNGWSDSSLTITENTISNNQNGFGGVNSGSIFYNSIAENSVYNVLARTSDLNATYNWWGTTNETVIKEKIYDYYDDYNLGKVFYKPYLPAPPGTIIVPDDYSTIQTAINAANDGDTVFVRSGTYYENVVVNKTLNLIGENRNSTIVDGNNTGNVVTVISSNANVSGFTFQNSAAALYSCINLNQVSGCSVFSNIADNSNSSADGDGIFLQSSGLNNISNNLVINTWDGITFRGSSNNTISGNTVLNLLSVGGTSIQFVYDSAFNQAIGNAFLGINQIGIRCYQADSGSNVLIGNTVENHHFGIYADGSSNNIFYHNSIINSTINQAYITGVNVWDNGYPSGGNYWSDYTGTDLFLGSAQNETGSDGIGDTPYLIDTNNTDHYPLMSPWTPPDAAALNISSSKTIVGEGFSSNVTVFLENQGSKIEELNATFYANETFLGSQTFMLRSNNSIMYSSDWNVSGLPKGNYSLSIRIVPLEGETELNDNSLNGSWVFITIRGDLNGDKTVDIYDAIILAGSFGGPVHVFWNANADINNDGIVDIYDAIILAGNFNKSWT